MADKVLIIDDDPGWVASLKLYLSRQDYQCEVAHNGLDGLRLLFDVRPSIVLLDLMMPDMDGWTVCDRVRELSDVPIIVLSGLSQEDDRVNALTRGADDYMTKPIALREMLARMQAVMRRQGKPAENSEKIIVDQNLCIDTSRWEVRLRGEPVDMTPTEMRFLIYLASNPGRVLTHQQILRHVWGEDYVQELNYTKLFAWRIRCKIEDDVSHPRYILTERGLGYRFAGSR